MEAGGHHCLLGLPFPHQHLRDSLPDPNCEEAIHSAPGTAPGPERAAGPCNFSGNSKRHTALGERAGIEEGTVILTNDHDVQMWASRDMGRTKVRSLSTGRTPGSTCGPATVPLAAV